MSKRKDGWMEIVEAIATPYEKSTKRQLKITLKSVHYPHCDGLCIAVDTVFGKEEADRFETLNPENGYWWYPDDEESRLLFACLMTAMSDKNYETLLNCREHGKETYDRNRW